MTNHPEWLEIGNQLFRAHAAGSQSVRNVLNTVDWRTVQVGFLWALQAYRNRNSGPLCAYLRSGEPLPSGYCAALADAIERGPNRLPQGRPKNVEVRDIAWEANMLFEIWRSKNTEAGVDDWGHREEMKDHAVLYLLEAYQSASSLDAVRELMSRPKSRQK